MLELYPIQFKPVQPPLFLDAQSFCVALTVRQSLALELLHENGNLAALTLSSVASDYNRRLGIAWTRRVRQGMRHVAAFTCSLRADAPCLLAGTRN